MCFTVQHTDDAGMIWWLHGGEDFDVIAALNSLAHAHLGTRRALYAFDTPASRGEPARVPEAPETVESGDEETPEEAGTEESEATATDSGQSSDEE